MVTAGGLSEPASSAAPTIDEVASLAGQLRRLSHGIIDEEVRRLARKVSSLSEPDMQQIAYTLHQVVEGMLVGRAAALPTTLPASATVRVALPIRGSA